MAVGVVARIVAMGEASLWEVARGDPSPRVGRSLSTAMSERSSGPQPTLPSASHEDVRRSAWDQTASLSALRGRIFTTLRAAFAL